ncbi:MAG: hypothetical protein GY874_11355 [Desulfobacteraceae bacterium]|nr:hypothetical protein [Desulfobacteraceae bacterium]
MKKVMVLIAIFVISACASIDTKREILPNNIFYSKFPAVAVKIGKSFHYKGKLEFIEMSHSKEGFFSAKIKKEYYVWQDNDNTTILILFEKIVGNSFFWYADIFKGEEKNSFSAGKEKIRDKTWQTWTGVYRPSEKLNNKMSELNLAYGRINLSKKWARKNSKSFRTFIVYLEDIDKHKSVFRKLLKRGKPLTSEESNYLQGFVGKANKSVSIIR